MTDEYHIDGLLPKAEIVLVYGASSSGKTFLVTDMLCAITRGADWNKLHVEKGRALYIAAESAGNYRKRLRAYRSAFNVPWKDLPFVIGAAPNLADEKDAAYLARAILDFGCVDLMVIDTLAASTPGADENSGKDMGKVMDHCRFIHRQTGATVVLVHHAGKVAAAGARGWSGLRAAVDAELEICRSGDYRSVTVTKLRDGEDGARYHFKLSPVNLGVDKRGRDITSCVVEHIDEPAKLASTKPRGKYETRVYSVVRALVSGSEDGVDFSDARACAIDEISKDPNDARERDRIRKGVERAFDALLNKRLLFYRDNRLYLTRAQEVTSDEFAWTE